MMNKYDLIITKLHQVVKEGVVPGVNYLILDHQHMIKEVAGMTQVYPGTEILKSGMLYGIASLTKVIGTVPVIAQPIRKGTLFLDNPVKKFLSEFNDDRPAIRNLLTHASRITGHIPRRNGLTASKLKNAFLTKMYVEDSLNRRIKYADVNYLYLGWIIGRIYDQPVQKVIAEQVLKPLSIPTATFRPQPANCVPTEVQEERGLIRGETHDPKGYILGESCGCADPFASLKDLEVSSHVPVENDLRGLLTSETTDLLFTDQTRIPGPHSRSLGWRLFHAKDRHLLISHTGFTGTRMVLDHQTDQGFIVLANRVHPGAKNQEYLDTRDQLFTIYLKEKEKIL